ncbi:MAG: hypothetical protein K1X92_00345 [Bacteroidia bacterium]|nr:hypothetical protein [Bacteroidia bacterium]
MLKSHLFFIYMTGLLIAFSACNKPDLALINSVKSFESQWQDMNKQLGFVDRNLSLAEKKYESNAKELGSFVSNAPADTTKNTSPFELECKRIILERNKIRADYQLTKSAFDKEVKKFNEWQGKLMKNKLNNEEAKKDFKAFQDSYTKLDQEIKLLTEKLTQNISKHNNITRDKAFAIGNYNNFHINMH